MTSGAAEKNGMPAPAGIYEGFVMHHRLKPVSHRFQYRVFSLALDLDRLAEAARLSWLFAHNRFSLFSFHDRDHGFRDGKPLRIFVEDALQNAGLDKPSRIVILCYPRIFGFVFNPLTVYFCWNSDENLHAIVYEVRNTFGGLQPYVVRLDGSEKGEPYRHEADKQFYVSPFIGMDMRYSFRVSPPGDAVAVRILEKDAGGPVLSAAFHGTYRAFTPANLAGLLFRFPFMTLKVVAAIHFEALRLWKKGAQYVPQRGLSAKELHGGPPIEVQQPETQ